MFVKTLVALLYLLAAENRPRLKWELNGNSIESLITQDTVSRGSSGTGDVDYNATGVFVSADGKTLTQRMRTVTTWENKWGSRLYFLNTNLQNYEILKLKNTRFSFDVDMSALPCHINAALYTVEMPRAGSSKGAQYGTGYCDAQGGSGDNLACNEFDFWEANSAATQLAVHSCTKTGQFTSSQGSCDKSGCHINPYKSEPGFYGKGAQYTVDTSKVFTVLTDFVTNSAGVLSEIRRSYIQSGKTYPTPPIPVTSGGDTLVFNSITDSYCQATDTDLLGGMDKSLDAGHVLVISLWAADDVGGMDWLDTGSSGPCTVNDPDGAREQLVKKYPDALVKYSNIKIASLL